MLDPTIQLVLFGAFLVHGLGHAGPLGTLVALGFRPGINTGHWTPAQSWLFPSLSHAAATTVASLFWTVSLIGFVLVALSFRAFLLPEDAWRPLAIVSALVSAVGIALFFRNWPMSSTVAALGMNIVAVLAAIAWPG